MRGVDWLVGSGHEFEMSFGDGGDLRLQFVWMDVYKVGPKTRYK